MTPYHYSVSRSTKTMWFFHLPVRIVPLPRSSWRCAHRIQQVSGAYLSQLALVCDADVCLCCLCCLCFLYCNREGGSTRKFRLYFPLSFVRGARLVWALDLYTLHHCTFLLELGACLVGSSNVTSRYSRHPQRPRGTAPVSILRRMSKTAILATHRALHYTFAFSVFRVRRALG